MDRSKRQRRLRADDHHPVLNRRAATLVELLVALAIGSVILGAATASMLRQQRTHARIAGVSASDVQLRTATSILAGPLAFIDAGAGDLTAGEAEDSAFQFRATVATAVSCDRAAGAVTFLPEAPDAVPLGGIVSQPRAGDSLWFMGDSTWRGVRITAVTVVTAACPAPFSAIGPSLRLGVAVPLDTIPAGVPLKVTRPTRYAFYRSSDGTWQLGFREWSEASGSFSSPQPVAGPFLRQADSRRSRFRYFGRGGEELEGSGFERSVARVRVVAHTLSLMRERGQDSVRSDSVDVALAHAAGP